MEQEQATQIMVRVVSVSVKGLSNQEIAAGNLSLALNGKVNKENYAYQKMRDLSLINEDGTPHVDREVLEACLTREVDARVENGTFK